MSELEPNAAEGMESMLPEQAVEGQDTNYPDGTELETQDTGTEEFDPSQWMLNIKGQQVAPTDRQHLTNLAQQGYVFSQNQEKLNKEREAFEAQRSGLEKYSQLDQTFQQHPELQQKILELAQQYQQGLVQPKESGIDPEIAQNINSLKTDLNDLKAFKEESVKRQADRELSSEIDQLKRDNPNFDWNTDDGAGTLENKIMQHAINSQIHSMKVAFRDFMWDNHGAMEKSKALKSQQAKQIQAKKAGIVSSGGRPALQTGDSGYKQGDSYSALVDKAVKLTGG